jgi:hypothetical protein
MRCSTLSMVMADTQSLLGGLGWYLRSGCACVDRQATMTTADFFLLRRFLATFRI